MPPQIPNTPVDPTAAGFQMSQPDTSPAAIPSTVPGMPGADTAPMTPEHKQELIELLSKVKQEYSKWRSMRFGVQNQSNEFRKAQLKEVFQILQGKGVNLNDPKSVSAFLNELKKTAPQHYEAITKALDYLLGTDYETQQQEQDPLNVAPISPEIPTEGPENLGPVQ